MEGVVDQGELSNPYVSETKPRNGEDERMRVTGKWDSGSAKIDGDDTMNVRPLMAFGCRCQCQSV